ncbi:MAG: BolA family transcriptional regulator [Acidocella sp.]|jgi:stress-induced morphogen|nr:BolA family transcriptional regulator [Acidocella sp.]
MTTRYERIGTTLRTVFAPAQLEITDESTKHARHAGRNGISGGETHYRVTMVAESLAGRSRVERSRAVHEALDAEFKTGLHALSLTLRTPEEAA